MTTFLIIFLVFSSHQRWITLYFLMHPLQSRSERHDVPSSSSPTQERLTKSLAIRHPVSCWEIGTAIWRWSLHIANEISLRDGQLTSREISYPSYHIARRHVDPRRHSNCTFYHLDLLLINQYSLPTQTIEWIFVDCHAALYQQIFTHLLSTTTHNALWIFDDMQTAHSKSPWLQFFLESVWYKTACLPSEWSDRLLAASKDKTILTQLTGQKA
jgi:predicted O-methyltransferase YrrM